MKFMSFFLKEFVNDNEIDLMIEFVKVCKLFEWCDK